MRPLHRSIRIANSPPPAVTSMSPFAVGGVELANAAATNMKMGPPSRSVLHSLNFYKGSKADVQPKCSQRRAVDFACAIARVVAKNQVEVVKGVLSVLSTGAGASSSSANAR
jgi:hypothetical protein